MIDPVCECSCGNIMDLSDGNGIQFKCPACVTYAARRIREIVDDEESYSRIRYMFIKG
jgi:tRNA(Ile2) C34 agmatinyltransferase TiaS